MKLIVLRSIGKRWYLKAIHWAEKKNGLRFHKVHSFIEYMHHQIFDMELPEDEDWTTLHTFIPSTPELDERFLLCYEDFRYATELEFQERTQQYFVPQFLLASLIDNKRARKTAKYFIEQGPENLIEEVAKCLSREPKMVSDRIQAEDYHGVLSYFTNDHLWTELQRFHASDFECMTKDAFSDSFKFIEEFFQPISVQNCFGEEIVKYIKALHPSQTSSQLASRTIRLQRNEHFLIPDQATRSQLTQQLNLHQRPGKKTLQSIPATHLTSTYYQNLPKSSRSFFQRKKICPNCNTEVENMRKRKCLVCNSILVISQ